MAIPKTIHYCWFGNAHMPDLAIKCIDSWKKFCPDYNIVEWNESNFDLQINKYTEQAYEKGKYAFVTDYVRLWVLYNYGGVYMDTDVEIRKNIDTMLANSAFSGFENNEMIPTGIIASEKNNNWIKLLLEDYNNLKFIKDDGILDLTTNVVRITQKTKSYYNLKLDGTYQDLGDVVFYPPDYLCAKDCETGKIFLSGNTYAIHHFNGSWHSPTEKKYGEMRRYLINRYNATGNILWLIPRTLLSNCVGITKVFLFLTRKVLK